jgi:hypothetical protein
VPPPAGTGTAAFQRDVKKATEIAFCGSTGPGQEPDASAGTTDSASQDAGEPQDTRLEVYGDSSYGSGEAHAAYRDAGHDTVIRPSQRERDRVAGLQMTLQRHRRRNKGLNPVTGLPAPFGPRNPVTVPGRMVNDKPSTAVLSPYRLDRPLAPIIWNTPLRRFPCRVQVTRQPPGRASAKTVIFRCDRGRSRSSAGMTRSSSQPSVRQREQGGEAY